MQPSIGRCSGGEEDVVGEQEYLAYHIFLGLLERGTERAETTPAALTLILENLD